MEASPEANGKENGKEKAQGKKNDEIEMVTLEIESTTVEPAAPKPVADERVAGGEDDDFEKQFEKQFKALKREGGWKTCLIIFLSIVCALLLCLLIVAMLNVAKYESFSSFECGTRPSLFPFLPPKPEAPTPKPEAPTPVAKDDVLSACSDHGYLFEGESKCECFPCFSGEKCEIKASLETCTIDVNSGSPEIFVEYWAQHPTRFSVKMSHRIGYAPVKVWERLAKAIKGVHDMVSNVNHTGKHLVFADGATPLIAIAQMAARSKQREQLDTCQRTANGTDQCVKDRLKVWAPTPYYSGYNPVVYSDLVEFVTATDVTPAKASASRSDYIEMITSPNNPDGEVRWRQLSGRKAIWDMAYYWPMYTAMMGPRQEEAGDISLWTLSKLTGHASSRVGWAWVDDEAIAKEMQAMACPIGCPLQSQMFAIAALEHVIETKGHLLEWGRRRFQARWERLQEIFRTTQSFMIANPLATQQDNYQKGMYKATTPYLWFNCTKRSFLEQEGVENLRGLLAKMGIHGRDGALFGVKDGLHARISLYCASATFDLLVEKLKALFDAADKTPP